MKVIQYLFVACLPVIPVAAFASSLTVPNTFTNATPAVASQVNDNFNAVKTAVDDNDARLDVLEPSASPIVVNCSTDANALQTALSSPRTGKLLINFSGTCNPVFIARSNVEIVGASRATAVITGATGVWNSSVTINNANYVKLKTLTMKRADDQFMVASAWRSNVILDDVLIDQSTGGNPAGEGFAFIQSKGSLINIDAQNIGAYVGSTVLFESGNEIINTVGSNALEINENSTVMVIGNSNVFSSTDSVLDMGSHSSFGFNDGSTGDSISGGIYMTASAINFSNLVTFVGDTSISINEGSSVAWEGSDGGPNVTVSLTQLSVQSNSTLKLENVDLTITNNFNVDGATVHSRKSNITAPDFSIANNAIFKMEGDITLPAAVTLTMPTMNLYDNAVLNLHRVDVTGSIAASRGSRITTQNVNLAGLTLQKFSSFFGQMTDINFGGSLNEGTDFDLTDGNISGSWELYSLNPGHIGYLNNATTTGATFNCGIPGAGKMVSEAYMGLPGGNGVCDDGDSDTFRNYQDNCPSVAGPTNGCP
jgi:hypothetical protein